MRVPLLSLSSSSSFLCLLPRLFVISISPFTFPSITCFRRQFLRKMWPIQLAFRFLISCRIFLSSLTLSNTPSFHTWSVQLIFSILVHLLSSIFSSTEEVSYCSLLCQMMPIYPKKLCGFSRVCTYSHTEKCQTVNESSSLNSYVYVREVNTYTTTWRKRCNTEGWSRTCCTYGHNILNCQEKVGEGECQTKPCHNLM